MNQWYVIHTKPKKEDEVSKLLSLAKIEALNPKVKSFVARTKPLFPNYIFVKWDLQKSENVHMIKYTRGVNRVLGTKEKPVPISDDIIELIRERLNSGGVLEQTMLSAGTRVKVKKGILKDLIGILEKPVSAEGRVAVLLKLYDREMRAKLHVRDVSVVS